MKKLLVLATLLLSGLVFASNDANVVKTESLEVKERLQAIELINVTAEKSEVQEIEPVSETVVEILEEAERVEAEEG
ncbi:MAG: hypothetical protein O7C67_08945 [Gammaproteobacteria bacterium]|nr:hypothetical protein [Gammaproteobacteria bacterium]